MNTQNNIIKLAWDTSWVYIKTVIDIVREPVLILSADLKVLDANNPFYRMFDVEPQDTKGKSIYELGDGQWNIPALRKLLEDILPKHTFFKGFEVTADFPGIGKKAMILNARQIYMNSILFSSGVPVVILAIEDMTKLFSVAEILTKTLSKNQSL
ncbi:MAG: PAS domain-containing protein [Candidatus Pacebacteria bacterium]|nr:PAS domain-containing protein [Candidatus Paceibacterota bacterium]